MITMEQDIHDDNNSKYIILSEKKMMKKLCKAKQKASFLDV